MLINSWLVVEPYPSKKTSSSVGMMFFSISLKSCSKCSKPTTSRSLMVFVGFGMKSVLSKLFSICYHGYYGLLNCNVGSLYMFIRHLLFGTSSCTCSHLRAGKYGAFPISTSTGRTHNSSYRVAWEHQIMGKYGCELWFKWVNSGSTVVHH